MYRPSEDEIEAYLEKMEDQVEAWHNAEGDEQSLDDYMGLTWTEYAYFVEHPRSFAHAKLIEAANARQRA